LLACAPCAAASARLGEPSVRAPRLAVALLFPLQSDQVWPSEWVENTAPRPHTHTCGLGCTHSGFSSCGRPVAGPTRTLVVFGPVGKRCASLADGGVPSPHAATHRQLECDRVLSRHFKLGHLSPHGRLKAPINRPLQHSVSDDQIDCDAPMDQRATLPKRSSP